MSVLTIRLPDKVINEINIRSQKLHISRSEYIRKSIENMNKDMYEQERKAKLIQTSKKVRKESMVINSAFSQVEYAPKT